MLEKMNHSKECIDYNEMYESDTPPYFRECICDEDEQLEKLKNDINHVLRKLRQVEMDSYV